MSKLDDERKQRIAAARDARIEALTNAAVLGSNGAVRGGTAAMPIVAAVLAEIERQVEAHAEMLSANKAAGWKSEQAVYLKAAPLFRGWSEEFEAAGPLPVDVPNPTPLALDYASGDGGELWTDGGSNATPADVQAFLSGETNDLGPVKPLDDPGPAIGGYVTPARAEDIRQEVEAEQLPEAVIATEDILVEGEDIPMQPQPPVMQVPTMVTPDPAGERAAHAAFDEGVPGAAAPPQFIVPTMVEPSANVRRERLTYPQFLQIAVAAPEPEHWSHSSVSSISGCGVRYVLDKSDGGGRPMWSNVGGTAVHSFIESWEIQRLGQDGATTVEKIWDAAFAESIAETERDHPHFPRSSWYVANRGKETEDWWRVEGLEMCRTYVLTSDPTNGTGANANGAPELKFPIAPGRDGTPMIEFEVKTTLAGRPFVAILDQVRYDQAGQRLIIVDPKSGSRKPSGPHQLVEYAHALALMLGIPDTYRIDGCYYMTRTGTTVAYDNLRQIEPLSGVEYRIAAAHRMRDAHIYPANPGMLCGSCGNNDRCPANGGGDGK